MPIKFRIKLTSSERIELNQIVNSKRKISAKKVVKARAVLLADESEIGPAYSDSKIVDALGIGEKTLSRLRKRVCEAGPLEALEKLPPQRPPRSVKIDGEAEAKLVQLACSTPPEGYKRWNLRLLGDKMVELEIVEEVSHETVRKALKKMNLNLG